MISRTIVLALVLVLLGTWTYAADCNNGGRYEVNGYLVSDGTVTDCRTGLIWLQDANCKDNLGLPGIDKLFGYLDWYDAMTWVAALGSGHCGLTDGSSTGDWRLPTKTEWMAMNAYAKGRYRNLALTNAAGTAQWTMAGDAFNNVQSSFYWSSTTDATITAQAWGGDMYDGYVFGNYKSVNYFVWPVRGGQSGEFGSVIIQ